MMLSPEKTRYLLESPEPVAWLVVVRGPKQGYDFPVEAVTNIGRDPQNHIVLEDEWVSASHATIRREGNAYFLFDLASRNGTYLNGQRIQKALILDGDEIVIGRTTLRFKRT